MNMHETSYPCIHTYKLPEKLKQMANQRVLLASKKQESNNNNKQNNKKTSTNINYVDAEF